MNQSFRPTVLQHFKAEQRRLLSLFDVMIRDLTTLAQDLGDRTDDHPALQLASITADYVLHLKTLRDGIKGYPVPTEELPEKQTAGLTIKELLHKIKKFPQMVEWNKFRWDKKNELHVVQSELYNLCTDLGFD